uniref:Uncharacterized protein n=1 Tax=Anopheles atroparvus TaxID=41427 RepID=A0A182IWG3_ANOAO
MFQLVWNYLILVLFLGALKAALSLRWPTIGEWRYDDLHPSLRYRDSSSAQRLLVNFVFFLVYPFVLLWRWYRAGEWTDWTDVEKDMYEQNVEHGEDELLRRGALRGRMIIQKQILLNPEASDEEKANDGFVETRAFHPDDGNELTGEEDLPLNLSKDADAHGGSRRQRNVRGSKFE